jgi:hypothetical protein
MGLLEYALEISPYNFDINIALLKIYDMLGSSFHFTYAHSELDLKSVLFESLGFMQLRHSIEFGYSEALLKPFNVKYVKYQAQNEKDLSALKQTSLTENNYDQIENFVDYERFHNLSY